MWSLTTFSNVLKEFIAEFIAEKPHTMRASEFTLRPALGSRVSIVRRRRSLFRLRRCSSRACLAWAIASEMFNVLLYVHMILVTKVNSEMTTCVSWVLGEGRRALENDAVKIESLIEYFITFIWNTAHVYIRFVNKISISFCSFIKIVVKRLLGNTPYIASMLLKRWHC